MKTYLTVRDRGFQMCPHQPECPPADAVDRDAAVAISSHPEQGWSLLCNGVVLFEDTGEILPDGRTIDPQRRAPGRRAARRTAVPQHAA